jgi:photosystem II stability/assembly factor-like uncharacterized protein
LNSNLEETGNFETTGQLSTVTCGSTECIVAGFGEFWIGSALTGVWKAKDVPGEFYTDLHQVSDSLIFACGIGGSIIKSEDGGANWNTLIKGSKFWSANAAFKAISFVDSNTGLVVGEHGLCRITYDGGNSWQTINNLPPVDFNDVAVFENTGIIVGAEGSIIRIDWP